MLTLKEATTTELETELRRRRDEEAARVEQEKQAKVAEYFRLLEYPPAKDLLKLMLPEHSRTTCKTDDDFVNVDRCARCTVLQAVETKDYEVLLRLSLNLNS